MEILDVKVQLWLDSARFVKSKPGVFILYDKKLNPLYIGDSENLQKQFIKYLDTNFESDECKQKTHTYQKLYLDNPKEKKSQLLEDYKEINGKLPYGNTLSSLST
jgi:excinuclease UvrABC nuclease subunit